MIVLDCRRVFAATANDSNDGAAHRCVYVRRSCENGPTIAVTLSLCFPPTFVDRRDATHAAAAAAATPDHRGPRSVTRRVVVNGVI